MIPKEWKGLAEVDFPIAVVSKHAAREKAIRHGHPSPCIFGGLGVRWRPQNETYLYGFRKHEQGQNAREIPEFDPLIVQLEKKIAQLRVPVTHQYELLAIKK